MRHRANIEGVGAQAVYGLGGKPDETAVGDALAGPAKVLVSR
jgi:hypothetical protein